MITGKNYIGNSLSAKGNITFKTFNPLLNVVNSPTFYEASKNELEEAVHLASSAFNI